MKLQYKQDVVMNGTKKEINLRLHVNDKITNQLKSNLDSRAISNLVVESFNPDILKFNVKTYEKLTRVTGIDELYYFPYKLFNSLSPEQMGRLIKMYYLSKIVLIEHTNKAIDEAGNVDKELAYDGFVKAINEITDIVFMVFDKDLIDTIIEFGANMPIPNLSDMGNRPQDSKDLTFVRGDYILLNAIIVITKIMAPLFGEIIYTSTYVGIDGQHKEIWACKIMDKMFISKFQLITDKLKKYIDNKLSSSSVTLKHAMGGSGLESVKQGIMAYIVVKTLPNTIIEDTTDESRILNIMTKIYQLASSGASYTESSKLKIWGRHDKSQFNYDDEDGSSLALDQHTAIFKSDPAKAVNIIQSINRTIPKILELVKITNQELDTMVDFYMKNNVKPNIYNEFMVILFFHDTISGGRSIKYLNYETLCKLMVLSQLLVHHYDAPSYLAHMITAKQLGVIKNQITRTESKIILDKFQPEFVYLNSFFTHIDNNTKYVDWSGIFPEIVNKFLIIQYHNYNTTDIIYQRYQEDNMNNTQYEQNENFLDELIKLISIVMKLRYDQ